LWAREEREKWEMLWASEEEEGREEWERLWASEEEEEREKWERLWASEEEEEREEWEEAEVERLWNPNPMPHSAHIVGRLQARQTRSTRTAQ
jgi:hypothetical protein